MDLKKTVSCIIETLVVNLVLYFIFYLQADRSIFLKLNPHPLFLLCIAMGMRYGTHLGFVTALISSLFYLKGYLYLGDLSEFFSYFQNYKYILLFFWSAVIFGAFRDNFTTAIEKAAHEKKYLEENFKQLRKSHRTLQKLFQELKKQIVNSEESILNLYQIASRLETLDSEQVYTETVGIITKFLKADAISIFTLNENSRFLRLKIRTGGNEFEARSLSIDDSPGLNKVVTEKKAVRWSDVEDDRFPLMSAPLIREGRVLAIVNIEHMDFDSLSEYAFQLFKLIIEWVNKALEQAIYVDGLKDSKYIQETCLMRWEDFMERLEQEERREKDFGMEYCLLQFKAAGLNAAEINSIIAKFVRTVDVVGYDHEGEKLYVLLPATPKDKSSLIEARILSGVGNKLGRAGEEILPQEKGA